MTRAGRSCISFMAYAFTIDECSAGGPLERAKPSALGTRSQQQQRQMGPAQVETRAGCPRRRAIHLDPTWLRGRQQGHRALASGTDKGSSSGVTSLILFVAAHLARELGRREVQRGNVGPGEKGSLGKCVSEPMAGSNQATLNRWRQDCEIEFEIEEHRRQSRLNLLSGIAGTLPETVDVQPAPAHNMQPARTSGSPAR